MRWAASWAFYWIGHAFYLVGDRLFGWNDTLLEPWFRAYQWAMRRSDDIQGDTDAGPWGAS